MYEYAVQKNDKKPIDEGVLSKIFELAKEHPDQRVHKIFQLRYVDPQYNKLTPWKKVSKSIGMSIQGCINIHNAAIKTIRKQLKNEYEFDI